MRTFVGCVILESLNSSEPLSEWKPFASRVEERPDSPDAPVWHVHWYQVDGERLNQHLASLAKAMRPDWYAHFWDGDDLCVILAGKSFWAKVSDRSTWRDFQAYGDTIGIDRKWTESVPTQLPAWVQAALQGANP
ncbi:MAG: hypothetical protein ACM3XM_12785 [Mycobacterium leprae]